MAVVVNAAHSTDQNIYVDGASHEVNDNGDLTVRDSNGKIIAAHHRSHWTNIQYGELIQPPKGNSGNAQSEPEPETGDNAPRRAVKDNPQA